MKLDFSQYHPLDHSLRWCFDYPGGRRRHVQYWWAFKGRERVAVVWKHATLRHEWQPYAWRDRVTDEWAYDVVCAGCDARPDPKTKARLIDKMKTRPLPDFKLEEN